MLQQFLIIISFVFLFYIIIHFLYRLLKLKEIEKNRKNIIIEENIENYIKNAEKQYSDIKAGTEKKLIFQYEDKRKTEYSLCYIHGFSASRKEIDSLVEMAGKKLGANVFMTRLSGHGRTENAMGEASASDWIADAEETYEIGRRIGEKVILIGVSTGGSLIAYLAAKNLPDLEKCIFISPNFKPHDWKFLLLSIPFAKNLLPVLVGKTHSFIPTNEGHAKYWTTSYPLTAVIEMKYLLDYIRKSDLKNINKDFLLFYSSEDKVVKPKVSLKTLKSTASKNKKFIEVLSSENKHVITGDILSPSTTLIVRDEIVDFILK